MKKIVLLLFATILLNLAFTSCIQEDIAGDCYTEAYILIPKEYKISAPFEKEKDNDYSQFLKLKGYYNSNFKNKIENNNNEYKLFYSLPKHYYKNSLTRRKFTEKIEFEITGTINGEEISEIVNFVVKIPYLLSDYNCSEFRVKTKNFGIINLLYLYYFN